jgi:molybdenum cofactor guanylyltransferase
VLDWQVRRAASHDAAMLAALASRLFEDAFARENTPEDMARYLATHFTPGAMGALLSEGTGTVLLLEQAGTPAGWAHLLSREGATEIRRFYVDGRWQGTGAAVTLMSAALAEARAAASERIWLAVWEHNRRAGAFYAKHGFLKVGTQPFQLGADVQTDEVLSRPLSFALTLAIVAGGRSRRLGGMAKPLIRVGGRSILERTLELRTLADEVLLVSADDRLEVAGATRVGDVLADRGAPGGVHAALLRATQPWVLAVAGDMPFLDGRAVAPLLAARAEGLEAVAYEVEGRLEPLAAVYRTALGLRWGEQLAGGGLSFRALWERLSGRRLDTVDPRSLRSLNTEADLATWADPPPRPSR